MGETDVDETFLETLIEARERVATCAYFGNKRKCGYVRNGALAECFGCSSYATPEQQKIYDEHIRELTSSST